MSLCGAVEFNGGSFEVGVKLDWFILVVSPELSFDSENTKENTKIKAGNILSIFSKKKSAVCR